MLGECLVSVLDDLQAEAFEAFLVSSWWEGQLEFGGAAEGVMAHILTLYVTNTWSRVPQSCWLWVGFKHLVTGMAL